MKTKEKGLRDRYKEQKRLPSFFLRRMLQADLKSTINLRKQGKIIKQHFQDVEAYWRKGLKDYSDLWENGLPRWVPERIHKTRLWDILQYILENTLERKEAKKICKDHGIQEEEPVL